MVVTLGRRGFLLFLLFVWFCFASSFGQSPKLTISVSLSLTFALLYFPIIILLAPKNVYQHTLLYIELTISFLIGRKRTVNFRNKRLWRHLAADYTITIIMSRTLKVTGNKILYDRSAWFLRVIMSSSRAFCCLPSVKKQKHDCLIFFRSMYNKTIIRFGFCDFQNNQGLGKGY